jgi:cytoskeletal protein CcmA (bactofilin family)
MFSRRDASSTDRDRTTAVDTQPAASPAAPPPISQPVQQPTPPRSTMVRNDDESLVAREDTFEGQLRTTRGVRIYGTVRGGVESAQYVHIEENAHVEADITAEEVVIAGEYSGKLNCRQRVEIRATGRVSGQIETQKLLLHEGGFFDGELHMQKPSDAPAAAPAKNESEERPRRTRYVDLSSDSSATREVGTADANAG